MKHKYHDVIMAFSEGAKIQVRSNQFGDTGWIDYMTEEFPDFNDKTTDFRIKPEIESKNIRYRVAMMCSRNLKYYFKLYNEADEINNSENFPAFVRWQTDWVEVEI